MYNHVALAVLRYTECLKVNVHYRTRVYQTQIVHFIKKLSETCLLNWGMQLCQLVKLAITHEPLHNRNLKKGSHSKGQNESPPHVPKRVLGRSTYLHSYRHESTWKLFRSWLRANYIAVHDNVHLKWNKCKMEQQLPLNGPWNEKKSMILDNSDKI